MKTVRIWFRKIGAAKYISHLDLNRCMARAMRRAAIPAWVTEGFNPHLFLTFALPLSLGQEGLDESMDIKLPDDFPVETLPDRLNAVLPPLLPVTRAAEAVEKPAAIASAEYRVALRADDGDPALADTLAQFLAQDEIPVTKKSKSGDRTIDLRPYLGECTAGPAPDGAALRLVLPAGSSENINPALLTDAFAAAYGRPLHISIVRTAIYDRDRKKVA